MKHQNRQIVNPEIENLGPVVSLGWNNYRHIPPQIHYLVKDVSQHLISLSKNGTS